MEEELVKSKFNGTEISFLWDSQDLMVNATDMARMFGKRVRDFRENERFNIFLEVLKKSPKFLAYVQRRRAKNGPSTGGQKGVSSNINLDKFMIHSIKGGETFMYRTLALKFAAWLDPELEVWIFDTIENILFSEKSTQVISYIHHYPIIKAEKKKTEEDLKNTYLRTNYYKLEEMLSELNLEAGELKQKQNNTAIEFFLLSQEELFEDTREIYQSKYRDLQKKFTEVQKRIRSVTTQKGLIEKRPDIDKMNLEIRAKHNELIRLTNSLSKK